MTTECGLNDADKLPAGVHDLGEKQGELVRLLRHCPEALLGGFWQIQAWTDNLPEEEYTGIGFLSGVEADRWPDVMYFVRYPFDKRIEVLIVKETVSILSMRPGHVHMTPREDLVFKINVMLKPAVCSPLLLPRLFENIRTLHGSGALDVDWKQMLDALPKNPEPGGNWEQVVRFVREMSLGDK